MTTKWYRAYAVLNTVEPVEVTRETDTSIFIQQTNSLGQPTESRRHLKVSDGISYHSTYWAARAALMAMHSKCIYDLEKQIAHYQAKLSKVLSMKEQND